MLMYEIDNEGGDLKIVVLYPYHKDPDTAVQQLRVEDLKCSLKI